MILCFSYTCRFWPRAVLPQVKKKDEQGCCNVMYHLWPSKTGKTKYESRRTKLFSGNFPTILESLYFEPFLNWSDLDFLSFEILVSVSIYLVEKSDVLVSEKYLKHTWNIWQLENSHCRQTSNLSHIPKQKHKTTQTTFSQVGRTRLKTVRCCSWNH